MVDPEIFEGQTHCDPGDEREKALVNDILLEYRGMMQYSNFLQK
jgi:hypothetical protein